MKISIKSLSGIPFSIDCNPSDTIAQIKQKITDKQGIPKCQITLIFAGVNLGIEKPKFCVEVDSLIDENLEEIPFQGDNYTLEHYNIQKESTIHLIARIHGD